MMMMMIMINVFAEEVPIGDYELPLSKAEIMVPGDDVTLIGWGSQLQVCHLHQMKMN